MRIASIVGTIAVIAASGCYQYSQDTSTLPAYDVQAVTVQGPPGGEMDPNSAYQMPDESGGYTEGATSGEAPAEGTEGQAPTEPSADPQSEGYVMGSVNDGEIDQTLQVYGEWIVTEEYGRVWRPHATVVGLNFTPYETCGTWLYTDFGWTFSCEWDWGWLPFHYGQWDWYDGSWCWVPGYTWSPAWVDWRAGGGYVGWRPTRPHRGRHVRDHRGDGRDRHVRDHRRRKHRDADWKFVKEADFSRRNIHAHTRTSIADGLASTGDVARPPVRAHTTTNAANVMRGRLAGRQVTLQNPRSTPGREPTTRQPTRRFTYQPPTRTHQQPTRQPTHTYQPPTRQPTHTVRPDRPDRPTHTYQPPTRTHEPTRQPTRTHEPTRPTRTYDPPTRTHQPSHHQPSRTHEPTRTYDPPTRTHQPSHHQPSRTHSAPSRSSSSHSAPSRSSSSGGSSRASSSSSSGSSSRASSSSSSSSSRSSSSSSSRSSSSGSSSSRSSSSGGGGRRR